MWRIDAEEALPRNRREPRRDPQWRARPQGARRRRRGLTGNPAGFPLSGPFSIEEAGTLPTAKLRYTQIAGELSETVEVISTGENAYVETAGTIYELPEERIEVAGGGAPTEG